MQSWKPNDWIRLIALVGAFLLFALGGWMLFHGIAAEGIVDLKSSLLSGTIKASSAGLYICFFALFIIVFVLASLVVTPREAVTHGKSRVRRLLPVFWGLLGAVVVCAIAAAVLPEGARSALVIALTTMVMSLVGVVTAMLRMAYEDA